MSILIPHTLNSALQDAAQRSKDKRTADKYFKTYQGKFLALGRVTTSNGLSSWGRKRVLLTDAPALYLHDEGGPMTKESLRCMSPLLLEKCSLVFAERSSRLRGKIEFNSGLEVTAVFNAGCGQIANTLSVPAAASHLTSFPISVICDFGQEDRFLDSRIDQLVQKTLDARFSDSDESVMPFESAPILNSLRTHLDLGELYCHVAITDGRLRLHVGNVDLLSIPVSRIKLSRIDSREIAIESSVMVGGARAESVSLFLPSEELADELWNRLDTHRSVHEVSPCHALVEAHVCGRVTEERNIDHVVELALGHDSVELHETSQGCSGESLICRFQYNDESLRWMAASDEFLITDNEHGPLSVKTDIESLLMQLRDHPGIKDAVKRSLAEGPYPLWCGKDSASRSLVACRVDGHRFIIQGPGLERSYDLREPCDVELEIAGDRHRMTLNSSGETIVLVGMPQIIEACYRDMRVGQLESEFADSPEAMSRALFAKDGEYLSFAIFGSILALHRLFNRELDSAVDDADTTRLSLPKTEEEQLKLAVQMVAELDQLQRHLEMITLYLPSFLVEQDGRLFGADQDGLRRVSGMEDAYRQSLVHLRSVSGEIRAMKEMLLRVTGIQALNENGAYAIAGMMALVGIWFPVALLGAGTQAWSAYKREERAELNRQETMNTIVGRTIDLWNRLVFDILPGTSHVALNQLAASRRQVTQIAFQSMHSENEQQRVSMRDRVIRRIAGIDGQLAVPIAPNDACTRQALIAAFAERRQGFSYGGFSPF